MLGHLSQGFDSRNRLLDVLDFELLQSGQRRHCLIHGPCSVGVEPKTTTLPDGFSHGGYCSHVDLEIGRAHLQLCRAIAVSHRGDRVFGVGYKGVELHCISYWPALGEHLSLGLTTLLSFQIEQGQLDRTVGKPFEGQVSRIGISRPRFQFRPCGRRISTRPTGQGHSLSPAADATVGDLDQNSISSGDGSSASHHRKAQLERDLAQLDTHRITAAAVASGASRWVA